MVPCYCRLTSSCFQSQTSWNCTPPFVNTQVLTQTSVVALHQCSLSAHKAILLEVTQYGTSERTAFVGFSLQCTSSSACDCYSCYLSIVQQDLQAHITFLPALSIAICISLLHCSRQAMPFERYTNSLCALQAGCLSCNLQSKASGLTCTSCGGWFMSAMLLSLILQSLGATLPARC